MIASDSACGQVDILRNFAFQNVFLASAIGTDLGSFKESPKDRASRLIQLPSFALSTPTSTSAELSNADYWPVIGSS